MIGESKQARPMDKSEFQRILELFPIVRPPNYCANSESARESTSRSAEDEQATNWQHAWNEMDKKSNVEGFDDLFLQKLRLAAESKVGPVKAERFCKAFQRVQKELVHEGLTLAAAQKFIDGSNSFAAKGL